MTPKANPAIDLDDEIDVALHEQIKWRAYEFYERQGDACGDDIKNDLQSELLNVIYAAAQLQKCSDGEIDSRASRAARVYLRALTSFIGQA